MHYKKIPKLNIIGYFQTSIFAIYGKKVRGFYGQSLKERLNKLI